ncbi:MAG: response regulator, partial [Gammaproteobacteria bacterium]
MTSTPSAEVKASRSSEKTVSAAMIYVIATVILLAQLVLTLQIDDRLVERSRFEIDRELTAVFQTTRTAIYKWFEQEQETVKFWSEHDDVRRISRLLLLSTEPRAEDKGFNVNTYQGYLDRVLAPVVERSDVLGYGLLTLDGVVLAGSNPSDRGKKRHTKEIFSLLDKVLNLSRTGISMPTRSHASYYAAMHVAASIHDDDNNPIAILKINLKPELGFTEILQRGRMGESGESYAFNRQGKMISESRFDEDLKKIGLVPQLGRSILTVDIRDPGGNLLEGHRPGTVREKQPLTLMAQSAIEQGEGFNLDGYNDYRGVPVIGRWMWDPVYELGITTEIDVAEAYASVNATRRLIYILSGIMGSLIIVLTVFFLWSRAKSDAARRSLQNQSLYQSALLDALPNPMFVKGADTRFTACNREYEKTFGISRKDFIGKTVLELDYIPEQEKKSYQASDEDLLEENGMTIEETRMKFADGSDRDVMYWRQTFDLADGSLGGMIGVLIDITARKNAEKKTKESEREFRTMVATIPGTVYRCKPDEQRSIEYISAEAENLTGYYPEDLAGSQMHSLNSLVYENDLEYVLETIKGSAMRREPYMLEYRLKHEDGSLRDAYERGQCVYDAQGNVESMIGTIIDITERKKMERALHTAKREAEAATKAKGDFLANMSHEIRTPMNAIIGLTDLALRTKLTPKQQDYLSKVHTSAISLLGIINDILDFSKIEAGKMDIESVPFFLDAVLENLATVVSVKTQEKGLELLFSRAPDVPADLIGDPLRLGQVLVNLCNNAVKFTHEGEILVYISLLDKEEGKARLKFSIHDTGIGMTEEQVGKLFQSFSQADTSTSRKYGGTGLGLAISKQLVELMGGRIWVESEPGEGSTFSFEVLLGIDEKTRHREKHVTSDIEGLRVLVVDDNPHALEILEAYLEQFGLTVDSVSSAEQAIEKIKTADEPYKLVLMDYILPGGMDGIEATIRIKKDLKLSEIPKIILVTAHGHAEYADTPGFELLDNELHKPVNPSLLLDVTMETFGHEIVGAARGGRHTHDIELDKLRPIQGAHILLTEDNLINQQVATELLEQAMFIVDIANNGQEALDKLEQHTYDCVLMDIQMPVMDGYTATRKIREQDKYNNLPVLAMTANAMVEDKEQAEAAGMNDHIPKPVNPQELFSTLLKWIKPGERELPDGVRHEDLADETASELPDQLFGIDIEAGLQRVGGNPKLFKKLLGEFYIDHGEDIAAIRNALEQNDNATAQRLAHTIKGVAATIGASELNLKAKDLETAIKQGEMENVSELVEQLAVVMAPVLDGLATLVPAETAGEQSESAEPVSAEEANQLLNELAEMIEEMDPDAEEKAADITQQLGDQADRQLLKQLTQQVSGFEFEEAADTLEKI